MLNHQISIVGYDSFIYLSQFLNCLISSPPLAILSISLLSSWGKINFPRHLLASRFIRATVPSIQSLGVERQSQCSRQNSRNRGIQRETVLKQFGWLALTFVNTSSLDPGNRSNPVSSTRINCRFVAPGATWLADADIFSPVDRAKWRILWVCHPILDRILSPLNICGMVYENIRFSKSKNKLRRGI